MIINKICYFLQVSGEGDGKCRNSSLKVPLPTYTIEYSAYMFKNDCRDDRCVYIHICMNRGHKCFCTLCNIFCLGPRPPGALKKRMLYFWGICNMYLYSKPRLSQSRKSRERIRDKRSTKIFNVSIVHSEIC